MSALERALERHRAQEDERELARDLRREATRSVLRGRQFEGMRRVIPSWWESVCTGQVHSDAEITEMIEDRLADTDGLAQAIIDDWA